MIPLNPGAIGENPALIVIDVQHDFTDEGAPVACRATSEGVADTEEVVQNINTVVNAARDADIPIIWTKEDHRTDYSDYGSELLSVELEHTMRGTKGWELRDDLDVDRDNLPPAEYMVTKPRYNCFHRTDIEHLLDTFDIDTVLNVGVAMNVCVLFTSQGAHERDYVYRVIEECTAGTSDEMHEAALKFADYLQPGGVQSMDAVIDALAEYDGNEIVRRVKETGSVYPAEATEAKR